MLSSEFEYQRVNVEGVTVNSAVAGSGSPVLLLHGYPQNHLMWRQVAPALARDHTVVLAVLDIVPTRHILHTVNLEMATAGASRGPGGMAGL